MLSRVTLPHPLYHRVKQIAQAREQSVDELVAELVENGLEEHQPEQPVIISWREPDPRVDREMEAFLSQHAELWQRLPSQYVAIYDGQLIDHDHDFRSLFERIDQQYPDTFVWMTKVEAVPLPPLRYRGSAMRDKGGQSGNAIGWIE